MTSDVSSSRKKDNITEIFTTSLFYDTIAYVLSNIDNDPRPDNIKLRLIPKYHDANYIIRSISFHFEGKKFGIAFFHTAVFKEIIINRVNINVYTPTLTKDILQKIKEAERERVRINL